MDAEVDEAPVPKAPPLVRMAVELVPNAVAAAVTEPLRQAATNIYVLDVKAGLHPSVGTMVRMAVALLRWPRGEGGGGGA